MMLLLEKSTFFRNCLRVAAAVGLTCGGLAMKTNSRDLAHQSDRAKEARNSIQILKIFRDIEERTDAQMLELFQPDFEIHWPPSLPYGGTFRGLDPRPNGWNTTWDPFQPTKAEKKMDARVIAAHGEDAVVLWHQRGLNPKGNRFDGEVLGLYTFRDGKLARAQMFYFDTAAVAEFLADARH